MPLQVIQERNFGGEFGAALGQALSRQLLADQQTKIQQQLQQQAQSQQTADLQVLSGLLSQGDRSNLAGAIGRLQGPLGKQIAGQFLTQQLQQRFTPPAQETALDRARRLQIEAQTKQVGAQPPMTQMEALNEIQDIQERFQKGLIPEQAALNQIATIQAQMGVTGAGPVDVGGLPERAAKPIEAKAGKLQVAKQGDATGLPNGTVFQADPKGNIKIISEPGGKGLSAKDKTAIAIAQAKEFRADERIKNFQIIERSEKGMQAALKKALQPGEKSKIASDQALGVLFQKMLDPTSVVRESEFARTPEGASLMSRITAQIPKLLEGGLAIEDDDRRALVDMAQTLLDQAKVSANAAFDEFSVRADEIGLNKKIVFGGRKRFDIQLGQQQFTPEQIDAELKRRGVIQ